MFDLRNCPLAVNAAPFGCDWCGRPLTRRQRRWCSKLCTDAFVNNHFWNGARSAARRRDRFRCVQCSRQNDLEVNHKVPLGATAEGRRVGYGPSCLHHLDGLETLCHEHHVEVTAAQRAAGLIWSQRK